MLNLPDNQSLQLSPEEQQQLSAALQSSQPTVEQTAPTGPDTGNGVHPLTPLIAQAVMQQHGLGGTGAPQSNLQGVVPQMPGTGLGSFISKLFTGHPLMHSGEPVLATSAIPDQDGLPTAMQLQPIGTSAEGHPLYDYKEIQNQQKAAASIAMLQGKFALSNPTYSTKAQLVGLQIPGEDADALLKAYPGGVSQKALSLYFSGQKNATLAGMADTRQQMVEVLNRRLTAMFEGPGAVQTTMKDAVGRMGNIDRAYGVYNQIAAQDFKATNTQRNLLTTEMARVINPSGVLTNEGYNNVAAETAGQKVADWQQWLTNEATPAQFKSFADQFKVLLDNERVINQSVFTFAQKFSSSVLNPGGAPPPAYNPPATPTGGQGIPPPAAASGGASGSSSSSASSSSASSRPDPATRFNQLIKGGLKKKQAYKLMHNEGY